MVRSFLASILMLIGISSQVPPEPPKTQYSVFKRDLEAIPKATLEAVNSHLATTTPELEIIAQCESNGKHFNSDGSVIRGKENPQDIGRFQISLDYHGKTAEKMGLDLFDETDNATYALWLFQTQGLKPWSASAKCWKDKIQKPPR